MVERLAINPNTVLKAYRELVVFAAVQIAMPLVVRPHLVSPARVAVEVSPANIDGIHVPRAGGAGLLTLHAPSTSSDSGRLAGAWVLSSRTVDPSGHAISTIPLPRTRGCAPPPGPPRQPPPANARPGDGLEACFAEINRLGYRQQVTYQPASRFWAFQWYETGIYAALALRLAGFCFWRLRRHPA